MKIPEHLINGLAGLLGSAAARFWMGSLDYKVAFYDRSVDPRDPNFACNKIYIFWHEYLLFPLKMCAHCNSSVLMSNHRDGEIVAGMARHLGFDCVRGSTNRGGARAIRELEQKCRRMNLGITPDGPRGPRRILAPGSVFLASALRLPLVALGFGYDRPWRMKNWDQFAIPRPGSRGRAVSSPEIWIPPRLDRDGIEHYRRKVETLLNRLTAEAEAWAESGTRKVDEQPIRRGPGRRLAARVAGADDVPQSRPQPEPELEKRFELHPAA